MGILRNGLMPHPVQVGVGRIIRNRILEELEDSTDVVISHFHGDHTPLYDANPYQLSVDQVRQIPSNYKIWANKCDELNEKLKKREEGLILGLNKNIYEAKGQADAFLSFLKPVPHGEKGTRHGNVTMTKISDCKNVFLHASDIQFLDEDTIDDILECKPDIVLASGPPIYLEEYMKGRTEKAWNNALKLAKGVKTLILDHHLLRCGEGLDWLTKLSASSGNEVICAADFMKFERHMLEAWRAKLYEDMLVSAEWHQLYAENKANADEYLNIARERYEWFRY
ncbi:Predicted hydrolase of the metallo-beta-lactamase superfamily [Peptoclostridium litorale DSM 5388]|uniref:Metallo-beta-lactamase domain-containing protein n=1 Tax=Peptoclostridium litorale DSM 5388 TaxID=1121324 RepID=A0A069RF88_PEPLI|nr:hypothetical protein [Peptoclostridium litorale]KDR95458.1 hypothetical protein UPF0282 [Peptoclostridium litorale DSM 5388]SIO18280.1 Predicted hydrolase of the metallo-beta-lactamase superfamily [Peptoclostridium litorale DSM 5388]